MDTTLLESRKLEYLKILILTVAGWTLVLTKLIPLETTFLLLSIISIVAFRRPFSEALSVPKNWFYVLVFGFVLLGIFPVVFYLPLGESSFNLIDHKLSAIVALVFVWIVWWQLKPSEDVVWWSLIFITYSVIFVIAYELYLVGKWSAIFTYRFGGLTTPTVLRFGIYSNLFTVILLGGFVWAVKKGSWTIFVLIVTVLISFIGSLVSDTRSAWAGLPEALIAWSVFYWLYLKRNSVVNLRKVAAFWIFFIVCFTSVLFYFGDRVEKRWDAMTGDLYNYSEGAGSTGSVGKRLVLFQAGIQGFLEKPWTGVGEDNSMSEQRRLTAPIIEEVYGRKGSMAFGHLHNQFIEEAFTRGVLGLMALLITIGYLLFFFSRGVKESKQSGDFSPWPLVGLLFVISSSISMMAEAWIHLSTGVIFYIFFITLFVFLSARTLANNRSEDGRVKKVSG
ncbi:O-antigen ligase family protein [Thiomicrorhabdus sp.]|uniref:O-antigen ligase family protein n=1 Tax=Thiomicrorhabdus sp. TaxID=2039724 RepID=UPI0035677EA9